MNYQTPKVSVLMPVYNTNEDYLRKAIESILNQTFKNFEFIIINDGSTNNAEDVILSYNDSRIKYLKQENQGIVSALNSGWEEAQGEYIARMDSDDISYPTRLEKQINFMDNNPNVALVGCFARIIPSGKIIILPKEIKLIDLLADCPLIHPTILFRKTDFEKYNLKYREGFEYAEDYYFYAQAQRFFNIANLDEILCDYRVYSTNSSSKNKEKRIISSFKVQDFILNSLGTNTKIRNQILNIAYTQKNKTSFLTEKIFSVKNLYKDWTKYKLITILGLELQIKSKKYNRE